MKLNIPPINHESLTCQEVLLLSVAEWWGREHVLMSTESWGFSYIPYSVEDPVIFAKRFGTDDLDWRSNLARYHGIQTQWYYDKTPAEIFQFATEEIAEGRPVGIIMDYFWCPWHEEYYQKYHGGAGGLPHTCLITGIDEGQLVCIDPTFAAEEGLLPLDHLEAGCGGYMTIHLQDEPKRPDWREILSQSVAHLGEGESSAFHRIRQFGQEFEAHFDLRFESAGFEKKPGFSPIIFKLKLIGMGRRKFAMLLADLADRSGIEALREFSSKLETCGSHWDRMSTHMMKAFYSKKPEATLAKVADLIRSTADFEEEVAREMKQFLQQQASSSF